MWSFETADINLVHERALKFGAEVVCAPQLIDSPLLSSRTAMLLKDPDGFMIEIFES